MLNEICAALFEWQQFIAPTIVPTTQVDYCVPGCARREQPSKASVRADTEHDQGAGYTAYAAKFE